MSVKGASVYLTFNGNCKEAMEFYKQVFGGEFHWQHTFGQSPMKNDVPEEFKDHITHSSLPLTEHFTLMGSDDQPGFSKREDKFAMGNAMQIAITPRSKLDADRLFTALSDGGSVQVPLQNMFWGSYHGALTDQFGVQWMFDMAIEKKEGIDSTDGCAAATVMEKAKKEKISTNERSNEHAEEPATKKLKALESA